MTRPRREWGRALTSFLAWLLLWTALAVVFASQLYFAGLPWPQALAWSIPRWYSWGLIAPAIFWLDRRIGRGHSLPVRFALHVPLGLWWTTVSIAIRLATRPLRGADMPEDLSTFFLDRFYSDLLIYAVLAGASIARDYASQVREREREANAEALMRAALERDLVEARLQGLRAQLNPHFLFNALNTISALTETDPPKARRVMEQTKHVLLAGEGADQFAIEQGLQPSDLLTPEARDAWQKWREQQKRDGAATQPARPRRNIEELGLRAIDLGWI